MLSHQSLDSRRPRFLRDVVGNAHVVGRLVQQMANGTDPQRAFLLGPTGSGKTTVAQIMVRHRFCRNRSGIGDPCGVCDRCLGSLEDLTDYEEWTGARLDADWGWWERNGSSILRRPWASIFIDEAQDLSERHQKTLFRDLEGATCQVIFATTHKSHIKDALLKRFGNNIYEMRRPTVPEVTDHLTSICTALGIRAETAELTNVAELNGCDLRLCVDFVYSAAEQAPNQVVTAAFVESVFGVAAASEEAKVTSCTSRLRL